MSVRERRTMQATVSAEIAQTQQVDLRSALLGRFKSLQNIGRGRGDSMYPGSDTWLDLQAYIIAVDALEPKP